MANLERSSFVTAENSRYADNSTQDITAETHRDSAADVSSSFVSRKSDLWASYNGTTGGTGNAYTVNDSDNFPASYQEGKLAIIKADRANTGAATLNFNALGAKSWRDSDGNDFGSGDISVGGIYGVVYDPTADRFKTLVKPGALQQAAKTVIETTSTSYSITNYPAIIIYNGSADATFTLPAISSDTQGKELIIINDSSFTITINRTGSDTFGATWGSTTSNSIFSGEKIRLDNSNTSKKWH